MEDNKSTSDLKDFRKVLCNYKRHWYWFVISIALCCLCGWFYAQRLTPKYEVRASIMLNSDAGVSTLIAAGMGSVSDLFGGNSVADDEINIMTSHSLLREISQRMDLNRVHYERVMPTVYLKYVDPFPVDVIPVETTIDTDTLRKTLCFTVKAKPSGQTYISVKAGKDMIAEESGLTLPAVIECSYGNFIVEKTAIYPEGETVKTKVLVMSHDQAAEDLRGQLNIALASKHSSIINMQMISDDTEYAVDVLNNIIDIYNTRAHDDNVTSTSASAKFLTERLTAVREQLDATEQQLASYKKGEGLTELTTDAAVIYEQMRTAEEAVTEQQVLVEMSKLTLDMVRASANDNSLLPYYTTDETTVSMIKSYNNLALQRMQLESGVKGDNTTLRRLDEQISALRNNLIKTLEASLTRDETHLAQLQSIYEETRGKVSQIPAQEQAYRQIVRQQAIEEELYTFLLQKREEASIMMLNINPKVKIIDAAYALNEDVSTSPAMVMLIAFLFGILIPPVYIYIRSLRLPKNED